MKIIRRLSVFLVFYLILSTAYTIPPPIGVLKILPEYSISQITGEFSTDVYLSVEFSSEFYYPVHYVFEIQYDLSIMELNTLVGFNGIETGPPGFVTSVDDSIEGVLTITGTSSEILPMGEYPDFLTINWKGTGKGQAGLAIYLRSLLNAEGEDISGHSIVNGNVIITDPIPGNVDNNRRVDIVDALMIARHGVGLTSPGFNSLVADVNLDNEINIVDALLTAQYHVGLIDGFSSGKPIVRYLLELTTYTESHMPILGYYSIGEVTVHPPGEIVYTDTFRYIEEGTEVTLESPNSFINDELTYDRLCVFLHWYNFNTNEETAGNVLKVIMEDDIRLRASYLDITPVD